MRARPSWNQGIWNLKSKFSRENANNTKSLRFRLLAVLSFVTMTSLAVTRRVLAASSRRVAAKEFSTLVALDYEYPG